MKKTILALLLLIGFGSYALANLVQFKVSATPATTRTIWLNNGAMFTTIGARTVWSNAGAVKQ